MAPNKMTFDELAARLRTAPFHQWLGLQLDELTDDDITVRATWREEFVVNTERGYTHGGILACLIDTAADFALAAKLGGPLPTVDMRVDYHRAAHGDMIVKARVIKLGSSFCTAEAEVYDEAGKMLASGRGVYHSSA